VLGRTRERQIAAFYAEHLATLQRTVARRARAAEQTIEDACQIAWATLCVRREPGEQHASWLSALSDEQIAARPPARPRRRLDRRMGRDQRLVARLARAGRAAV
jgi:hypothetical protein